MFSYYRWRREFGGLKSEPGVLELKVLQALHLLTPIWRIASTMFWPCETKPLRAQFGSQQRPQDKHGLRDLFFRKEK